MLNQQSESFYYPKQEDLYYYYQSEVPRNRGGRKQVKPGTTKRNARERNRVKYINNCFETLREHIPYEMFVEDNKVNGNQRKLSKVETLKYASLYIQKLTELLEQSNENQNCQNMYNDTNQLKHEPYVINNFNNVFNTNNDFRYNQFTSSGSSIASNEYVYSPASSSSSSYSFY